MPDNLTEKTVYVTTDGEEFTDRKFAEQHQVKIDLATALNDDPLGDLTADELVQWLARHYLTVSDVLDAHNPHFNDRLTDY